MQEPVSPLRKCKTICVLGYAHLDKSTSRLSEEGRCVQENAGGKSFPSETSVGMDRLGMHLNRPIKAGNEATRGTRHTETAVPQCCARKRGSGIWPGRLLGGGEGGAVSMHAHEARLSPGLNYAERKQESPLAMATLRPRRLACRCADRRQCHCEMFVGSAGKGHLPMGQQ